MRTYIIGIAGNKNSGKDTVASIINYIFAKGINKADYNDWYINKKSYDIKYYNRIVHFADNVKEVLSIIYNIPRYCFEDRKYKDDYYYCFNTNSFLYSNIVITGNYNIIDINKLTPHHTLSNELATYDEVYNVIKLRFLMQYFGTDVCRNHLDRNIWINSAMNKIINISKTHQICIVPDVRFTNECMAITKHNSDIYGEVIKINRINTNIKDKHISENIYFSTNYVIDNNEDGLDILFNKVLNICKQIVYNNKL